MPTYPFPRPPRFSLRVRRSAAGLGLFTEEDIPARSFLIEYWGTLVSADEANRVGGKYLFDLENGKAILGALRKNTARYANHSCKPNAEVRISADRVFLYSLKPIRAGEEIGYDYGKEYVDAYIKPHGCLCQSCAGKKNRRKHA